MSFFVKLPLFNSSTHPEASNSGVKPAHTTCMSKQRIKPSGRTTPGGLTTVSDSHACMGIQTWCYDCHANIWQSENRMHASYSSWGTTCASLTCSCKGCNVLLTGDIDSIAR